MEKTVRLTDSELDSATQFALEFWDIHNRSTGMNHDANIQMSLRKQFSKCMMGFRAELAVAKFLGLEWKPKLHPVRNSADLGEDIQIRAISNANQEMIIRKADQKFGRMHHRYILVHAHKNPKVYTIIGWTFGINVLSKKEYWTNKGNGRPFAWFIPQEDLYGMGMWDKSK